MAGKLFHHPFEQYLDLVVWRCVKIAPEQKINKKYEAPYPNRGPGARFTNL
jgi:hypothetical protein